MKASRSRSRRYQRHEGLALEVQKVLLGHLGVQVHVAAGEHPGQLARHHSIVVGDVEALLQEKDHELEESPSRPADHPDLVPPSRWAIPRPREGQHRLLGIIQQVVLVHRDSVVRPEEAHLICLLGAGRHLGHSYRLKDLGHVGDEVGLGPSRHRAGKLLGDPINCPQQELLAAARGGDDAHSELHLPHVGLRVCSDHARCQAYLAPSAQRHAERRRYHRLL